MKHSMQHWNGCQLVVIDTETSGLDPFWHEILQIAMIALDSNCEPRKDIQPFFIELKPENPERTSQESLKINQLDLATLLERGHDPEKAKDMLTEWVDKLGLPLNAGGVNRCKVIPLGQNFAFDMAFMKHWLGSDLYNEIFHYHFRDTMISAVYLNDRAGMHVEKVPFSKCNLAWLAKEFNIDHSRAHNALADCLTTAKVYKNLLNRGLLG